MVCFFVSFKYGMKFCLLNWLHSHLILVTTNVFIALGFFFCQLQVVVFVLLQIVFCECQLYLCMFNKVVLEKKK